MLIYILKSSACLAIFFLFYKLVLEKENMHVFKRFYLLISLILSIIIPWITFTTYVEYEPAIQNISDLAIQTKLIKQESQSNLLPIILWSLYSLGVLFFGIKFYYNISNIIYKIKNNSKQKINKFTNVLLLDLIIPHTFFNYIFLNKQKFETHQIPREVLLHEQTHAKQKHSIDILIIEVLQVMFWFNPLIYFIKHSIKLNHEFLADEAVLKKGTQTNIYQKTLLEFSTCKQEPQLANAINYSSFKKRFAIMKTHTTKKAIWLRSLYLIPLLTILLYSFSDKVVIENEKNTISQVNNIAQDKASPEQLAEYNKLAKHYNTQSKNNRRIKLKDVKRLEYIYSLMTPKQKKNAEAFPDFPPPPPPISEPKVLKNAELPPPPPIPVNATAADKKKYQKTIENYKKQQDGLVYKHRTKNGEVVDVVVIPDQEDLPPPPMPPNPFDHMIEMAKKGAIFYYNDKKITSEKALQITKKNKSINIQILGNGSSKPIVKLSKKPIVVGENLNKDYPSPSKSEVPNKLSKWKVTAVPNKVADTLSKWKVSAVPNNKPIILPKDADFYINDKKVSYAEVKKLNLNNVKKIHVKKDKNKVYITL